MGASVTVKTAAATQAILDQTIKAVEVLPSGKLRFTRWDNSTFDTVGSLIGPEGPEGPVNEADLTALKDDIGYGILDQDKVTVEQTWGFDEDGWNTISGLSVTFDQVINRSYEVNLSMLMASGADLVLFEAEIMDGATPIARFSNFAPHQNRATSVGGVQPFKAGSTATKTLTVRARAKTPNDVSIRSDYIPTRLVVTDIGID